MTAYFVTSIICSACLYLYNNKKRFTVKISYVLLFLATYALLNSIVHNDDGSNVYFAIMFAFPSLFVSNGVVNPKISFDSHFFVKSIPLIMLPH